MALTLLYMTLTVLCVPCRYYHNPEEDAVVMTRAPVEPLHLTSCLVKCPYT